MRSEHVTTLWQGIYAGLVGYGTLVVLFIALDALEGRPFFYTPALLGSRLFYGLSDPAQLVVWAGPVISYNAAHLIVFLIFGMVVAWLGYLSERGPQLWYLGLCFFLLVTFHLLAAMLIFTQPVRAAMPMWTVIGATFLAALAMGAYVLVAHPRLRYKSAGTA
jgi:uncharacterized membrane protein (UPF0136 family)